jgi:hypothetical protein
MGLNGRPTNIIPTATHRTMYKHIYRVRLTIIAPAPAPGRQKPSRMHISATANLLLRANPFACSLQDPSSQLSIVGEPSWLGSESAYVVHLF